VAGGRLTSTDKRALALWILAGILGAVFAQKYFFRAFPEASVNFQVSREEAQARAQKFVTGLGENVSGYQSTIVFNVDDNAKVYLERQVGLQEANRLMASELNIWFWEVRFFKPQQEEEFRVNVSPAGQIVGYSRVVPKPQAGATLDRAAAHNVAQSFLVNNLGLEMNGWDFLPEEANSEKMPARLDWSFTWEKHGFRAKDAPYRLQVGVQGNRAGSSEEFLKVPETWKRSYAHLRAGNDFLTLVTFVPYVLLLGAALWMGISLTRQGQVTWGAAIKLGLVVAAVLTMMQLNEWPIERAGYNTNSSYGNFVFQQIATAILFGLASALTVSLVYPAGEAIYRATQPGRLQLSKALTLRGLRSQEFFSAAIVGLSLTALSLGFVVAFYMMGSRFGVWAPQELNYTNSVSTIFPWIEGVAIGLLASTNEEFTFRMFAIPFVERITGSRWLAVILPAFCWSFLHANYPQEPPYIRGIEIGIMGLATGLVMLRWGILATLIWHYTFDAAQVGLLLIRSNSLYFKISGVAVGAAVLAPLAFACVSYLTRGRFEEDEDLMNRSAPKPELAPGDASTATDGATSSWRYDALAPGMIGFLAICLLVGGVLAWRLKPASVGDYLKLSINAGAARARGDEVIRGRGLDPNSYYHSTVLHDATDPVANEFLRERIGVAGLNAIYAHRVPGALWRVRYFRDSQPEEFAVILRPDGTIHSVRHTLAEETPGASLTKEEAVARAEKFLREEKKIDLNNWTLVESSSDKRPNRTDHTLIWEEKTALDSAEGSSAAAGDHAHARMEIQVLGDEVANYRTFIKIPDDWRRKQGEATLARTIFSYSVPILLFAGLGLAAVIVYLKDLKSEAARAIPWRRIALWSVWGLAGYLVVFAAGNRIPEFLNTYQTFAPFKLSIGVLGVVIVIGGPFYFGAITVLFGLAWYYARREYGEAAPPDFTGMPAAYYRDALWIGLGGTAGLLGLERLLATLSTYWPTIHRELEASFGQEFDAYLPGASILGAAVLHGLFYAGLVAVISAFVASQLRQPWLRLLLLLTGALALAGGGWGSPADLGKQFLARVILLAVLVFGVRNIMRFNILGCFLVVAGTSLLGGAADLLAQPDSFYRANSYGVLLAWLLLLAWPLAAWRVRSSANTV
jgi:membrane protease YdiL (CAAX protease family)